MLRCESTAMAIITDTDSPSSTAIGHKLNRTNKRQIDGSAPVENGEMMNGSKRKRTG
jgi:hypothetical protein